MKAELLTAIPQVLAKARTRIPAGAEVSAALTARLDLAGPRLAMVQALDVINEPGIGVAFKHALLATKSTRQGWGYQENPHSFRLGVMSAGEGDYLVVGSYMEKATSTFHPAIAIGREGRSSNPGSRLRLMRQSWDEARLQLEGALIEAGSGDQVIEGFLRFLAMEAGDEGLGTPGHDPSNRGSLYLEYKPLFTPVTHTQTT